MNERHNTNSRTDSQAHPDIEPQTDSETEPRYATLETGDGDLIIYDREHPSAWLQSDHTAEILA